MTRYTFFRLPDDKVADELSMLLKRNGVDFKEEDVGKQKVYHPNTLNDSWIIGASYTGAREIRKFVLEYRERNPGGEADQTQ